MKRVSKYILIFLIIASFFILCSCNKEKEITFRVKDGYIQWQYVGDTSWNNIISVSELNESGELSGKSAYDIACENGFTGTVEEWLESLKCQHPTDSQEAQAPTSTPDEEPTIPSDQEPNTEQDNVLKITSITTPITGGKNAKIEIIGKPNTQYTIEVHYSSGISTAKGLEPTVTDNDGYACWTWKIGASTSAGSKKIVIHGGGEEIVTYIEIE